MSNVESFLEDGEEEPPPPPVRGWPLAVLVAVVSFFVWIFVGAAIGHSESTSSPGPTVTATVTVTVAPGTATTAAIASAGTAATVPTTAGPGALVPPAVGGRELVRLSGSGDRTSRTFTLTGDTFTLAYAYDCSAFGSTGAFQVNLERGSVQVDLLANELGKAARGVTHARQDAGSYYLLINSHCSWTALLTQ